MELTQAFSIRPAKQSRIREVDFDHLEFGKYVADHMLVCDYGKGKWNTPEIIPFGDLTVSPTTLALHYGQTVFEGMKAFRMEDGRINIFRIHKHYERLTRSLDRMCMAIVPEEVFIEGLRQLIELDKAWVPAAPGTALYIRPFAFASEAKFGVKVSDEYKFIIFSGPVAGAFQKPLRVKVETGYARAARGGTGAAKCGGNYGGAYYPTQKAKEAGYDQVLWTDSHDHQYIEESGMMNALFVIDGKLVTPPLSDSILDGITRDSLLTLAGDLGIPVETRPVSLDELEKAFRQRLITEAFGAGTAAIVAPIGVIHSRGIDYQLPEYTPGAVMFRLKDKLEAIRTGKEQDKHNWNYVF
ncbi:branched-chain amino acid aminotransferase [Pseudoflavitalea sp. X16]|uniref:branched-chain amino acid aminotransferase n=1 Tax=Paraflavitalea devenefica TaxID=2716334 RepID=UPI001421A21B|nr:branched-chain amino acid aminotransferase [Paraflavitalea devenefica]NII24221.1 branched-chain amino acid aminotransferase [Paraflavitalea devenefica]